MTLRLAEVTLPTRGQTGYRNLHWDSNQRLGPEVFCPAGPLTMQRSPWTHSGVFKKNLFSSGPNVIKEVKGWLCISRQGRKGHWCWLVLGVGLGAGVGCFGYSNILHIEVCGEGGAHSQVGVICVFKAWITVGSLRSGVSSHTSTSV